MKPGWIAFIAIAVWVSSFVLMICVMQAYVAYKNYDPDTGGLMTIAFIPLFFFVSAFISGVVLCIAVVSSSRKSRKTRNDHNGTPGN